MTENRLAAAVPVSGVLGELMERAERLGSQQFALFRAEIHEKLDAGLMTAKDAGVGVALFAVGGAMTTTAVVHFLHRMTKLPLWCCYALAGGAAGLSGLQLLRRAKAEASTLASLPQTTAGLRENMQWLKRHVGR